MRLAGLPSCPNSLISEILCVLARVNIAVTKYDNAKQLWEERAYLVYIF